MIRVLFCLLVVIIAGSCSETPPKVVENYPTAADYLRMAEERPSVEKESSSPVANPDKTKSVPPTKRPVKKKRKKSPLSAALKAIKKRGSKSHFSLIAVNSEQLLYLFNDYKLIKVYQISASKYGIGSESGSNKTPRGLHLINAKFGGGVPAGGIFEARSYTNKKARIYTDKTDVKSDRITSRILSLQGLEPGINKGSGIDSLKRHIYIHGTNEEGLIGTPASHGCLRMKNKDVIDLFSKVPKGTLVYIAP